MPVTFVPVVDVSEHQGEIDFVKMRAAGVQGLILRVSHGQTIDARYGVYYQRALDTGFESDDICHYTFINPKRGTGAQCAARTLAEIDKVVGHTNVGYMPDVENYRDESPNRGQAPVYGPAFADHIREHLATVLSQAPGAVSFGYGNLAYWNGKVAGTNQQWVGDDALAVELEWLAARYPAYSDAQYARLGYPGTPETWHDWAFKAQQQGPLPPRGGKWWGWQFSAGWNRQGPVYGATSGDLDLNIVHPDAWARWTNTVPFPPPIPHPISEDDDMTVLLTNAQAGKFGPAYPNGGYSVFELVVGTKRQVSFEEYQARGWPAQSLIDSLLPCSDAILNAIPDYVAGGGSADAFARDQIAHLATVVTALNDATARTGQVVGDIQKGLGIAADARA